MNPTAGSFTIDPRLQRHFTVFAVSFPGMVNISFNEDYNSFINLKLKKKDALQTIYNSILSQNLANGFQAAVAKYSMNLVNVALTLHQRITVSFLPTAIKFHYTFNLRDLSNVFQVRKLNINFSAFEKNIAQCHVTLESADTHF